MAKRTHWKTGGGILLIGILILLAACLYIAKDATYLVFYVYYITPGIVLAMLLWWVVGTAFKSRVKYGGLAAFFAVVGLYFLCVRLEGFTGDMKPFYSLRWNPSREARVADALRNIEQTSVDLNDGARLEVEDSDWPRFRGDNGDGVIRLEETARAGLHTDWKSRPPKELWRHAVGKAWSSFAVVGDFAFTQEQRGAEECVVCYEAATGKQVWVHADDARHASTMGGVGPRATPTIHDSHLYALGGTGILNCLDPLTGEKIWTRNVLEDAGVANLTWGMAGSPLIVDDMVIVNPGGDADSSSGPNRAVLAVHRKTGEIVWGAGDEPAGYCAPRVETIDGVRQIVVFDGTGLAGYADDGAGEQWRFPWTNDPKVNAAQPIPLSDDAFFISSGYAAGSARVKVKRDGNDWSAAAVWTTPNRFKLKFNDAVLKDGHIYGLDEGILSCIDASDGSQKWKKGRFKYGQILLLDDLLIVLHESGKLSLLEISPEGYHELGKFQAIEGVCWNNMAYADGRLFIRSDVKAACFELGPPTTVEPEPQPQDTPQKEGNRESRE